MSPVVDKDVLPVRLVVLNHNGGELTLRSLRHLLALEWPSGQLQIVCLDNDSSDGSVERIENELPQVEVRRLGSNTGFPANNEALNDLARVRYVGLVNNDAFVEPSWLRELVDALDDDPGVGGGLPQDLACAQIRNRVNHQPIV
jgi:GT2 family glycosyltransferase